MFKGRKSVYFLFPIYTYVYRHTAPSCTMTSTLLSIRAHTFGKRKLENPTHVHSFPYSNPIYVYIREPAPLRNTTHCVLYKSAAGGIDFSLFFLVRFTPARAKSVSSARGNRVSFFPLLAIRILSNAEKRKSGGEVKQGQWTVRKYVSFGVRKLVEIPLRLVHEGRSGRMNFPFFL